MASAYVDSSALVAVAFGEPGADAVGESLNERSRLVSSNLLEAEVRAAFAREGRPFEDSAVYGVEWILPTRALTQEIAEALRAGYLRGADLWHLATALYARRELSDLAFITLDIRQRTAAQALGFQT